MPNSELESLFRASPGTMKWAHYFEAYNTHLARFREKPCTLLEIGVLNGGSLLMWKRWLHPDSVVVGIDIEESCSRFNDLANNTFVRIGSQSDADFLAALNSEFGPFDVIIDDGSHLTEDQRASFFELFVPALADDGVYVVEDLHTNYWPSHHNGEQSFIDTMKALIDSLHDVYKGKREPDFLEQTTPGEQGEDVNSPTWRVKSISFWDSMVFIQKGVRAYPRSIRVPK